MSELISIMSEGKNRKEAFDNALGFADMLVEQHTFDYHSGEGETHRLISALGREAIEAALATNCDDFMRAMHIVRLMLRDFTDEQIYQEQFHLPDGSTPEYYASRWQFAQLDAPTSALYATEAIWGGAITNDSDYATALSDQDPKKLWVTIMDFHR